MSTSVSSIYEYRMHQKLAFSSKFFYQEDAIGFFIQFEVQFFLQGGNTLFFLALRRSTEPKKLSLFPCRQVRNLTVLSTLLYPTYRSNSLTCDCSYSLFNARFSILNVNYEFVKLSRKQLRIIVCMEVPFQCEVVILAVDYRTKTFYRSYESTLSMYIPNS